MRKRWRCGAAVLALLGGLDEGGALAQSPLDFLFGHPPRPSRSYRPSRGPPRPQDNAETEAPLPVPRPHFPQDGAPAPVAPATPAVAARAPEPKAPEPETAATTARATPSAPPEPPPRPPETVAAPPPAPVPAPASTGASPHAADQAPAPATLAPPKPPEPPPRPTDLAPAPAAEHATSPPPASRTAPAPTTGAVAPSGATADGTPRLPADDPACPAHLKAMNVAAEPTTIGPQPDARCVVVEPVRLTETTLPDGSKIDFPDRPTLACVTAETFVRYVSQMLSPLAKGTYGAPVTAVWTGPGLDCRSRDHIFGAKLSEHGLGLAIDIAQLKLANDRVIAVGAPKTPADDAFEAAARAAGCGYFHTVLGPGSDTYHRTHWHFDLEPRGSKGDGKFCK